MFPTSSLHSFASTILRRPRHVIALGFALIWFVFAATLIISMGVAVYRTIPRPEL